MSEYTTTPNLGLFKPNYDMDDGQWGYHLNTNADKLDAALGSSANGPFLPLTGGTVTGSITVPTLAGSPDLDISPAYQGTLHTGISRNYPTTSPVLSRRDYNVGGAVASGAQPAVEVYSINSETVDATHAQGGGLTWFSYGGVLQAGAVGGRTGFGVNFVQSGATTMTTGQYYVSGAFFIEANAPAGVGASTGTLFASNDSTLLKTGAGLNWDAITGYEITIGAQAGTGVNNKTGMTIVQWDTDRVAGNAGHDYAYGMSAQGTCAGWDVGYAIGNGYGWWPMKATGTLIGTIPPNPGGPAYAAAWGIDFSAVAFSGGLIRGPVFSVNSAGKIASSAGVAMGSATVSAATDLSRHLDLYNGQFGMCVASSGALNIVTQGPGLGIYVAGALQGAFNATGLQMPVGQGTAYPGAFTTLTASGAVSGAGFVTLLAPYATTANVAAAYLALAGGTLSGGLHFGSATVTTDTNLTRHLDLYGGNYGMSVANSGSMNIVANSGINVYVNAARVGVFTGTGLDATVIGATAPSAGTFTTVQTGSTVGPTWTTGSAAPAATAPVGSLYSRVGGAVGATLYVSRGGGTWAAIAGV